MVYQLHILLDLCGGEILEAEIILAKRTHREKILKPPPPKVLLFLLLFLCSFVYMRNLLSAIAIVVPLWVCSL